MYKQSIKSQTSDKKRDPFKFESTSNSKKMNDSESKQQENIKETNEVKRSANEIFKSQISNSRNKTKGKKEKKTENDEKNKKDNIKKTKNSKKGSAKDVKKSSFKSMKNEKNIKANNTNGENDQDYKLDGFEIQEKKERKGRKRKDQSTKDEIKSTNLIEKLNEIISDVDEEINSKVDKREDCIESDEKVIENEEILKEQLENELNEEIKKVLNENKKLEEDKNEAEINEEILNNMLDKIKVNKQIEDSNAESILNEGKSQKIANKEESKSQERFDDGSLAKTKTLENRNEQNKQLNDINHISLNEIKYTTFENDSIESYNANFTSVNKENTDEQSPFDDIIDENDQKTKDSSLEIRNNSTEKKQEAPQTIEANLDTNINQSSIFESILPKSTDENKSEEESSLVLTNNYRPHNSTYQTNFCMVETLYRRFANGSNPCLNELSQNLNTEVNMVTRNMKGLMYEINKAQKDIHNYRELNDSEEHLNIYKDRLHLLRRFHESVRFNWLKKNNKLTNEDIDRSKGWFNSLMRSLSIRSNCHKKQRVYLKMLVSKFLKGELINFEMLFKKFNLLIN